MSTATLTSTSYIVLGLLEQQGTATPYELKRTTAHGIGYFWSIPHTQLYNEPSRLAAAGYLSEEQELTGRRRKLYTLTEKGHEALDAWRSHPTDELTELRDPGLLQLFFGAELPALAEAQIEAHTKQLATYEDLRDRIANQPECERILIALEAGIGHEQEWLRFWRTSAAGELP